MKMNILKKLETMQSDHEASQVNKDTRLYETPYMHLIKNMNSKSIFATRVVFAHETLDRSAEDLYKEAKEFFQYKKFSWFLNAHEDKKIYDMLISKAWSVHDHYDGQYLKLEKPFDLDTSGVVEVIGNSSQVDDLVTVIADVFDVKALDRRNLVKERANDYLLSEDKRGGYILIYVEGIPLGYATYRLSACKEFLYLSGTGVVKSQRGKGLYKKLLFYRLNKGLELGAKYALAQGRKGHSSPILNKYGFITEGKFKHLISNDETYKP